MSLQSEYDDNVKALKPGFIKNQMDREILPPPPPPLKKNPSDSREKLVPTVARAEEEDIFVGEGTDYAVPTKDMSQSPISEDMEESPRNKERMMYYNEPAYGPVPPSEPAYGPVPPSEPSHDWQPMVSYLTLLRTLILFSVNKICVYFMLNGIELI